MKETERLEGIFPSAEDPELALSAEILKHQMPHTSELTIEAKLDN